MVCRVKQLATAVRKKSVRMPKTPTLQEKQLSDAQAIGKTQKALNGKIVKYLEKEFTQDVIDRAQELGWKVAHFPPIQTASGHWMTPVKADGKGWLDLFMLRRKQKMVLELKTETKMSDEQVAWAVAFQEADIPTHVVIPGDWPFIIDLLTKGPK